MVISRARGRRSPPRLVAFLAALWLGQFAAEAAFAVEAPEGDSPASAAPDDNHSSSERGAADPLAKNQTLMFAFVMLACIIVGGTMLLALVVIWGNRTRRLAQSPLPPIAKRDELWFLKPKKEPPEDTATDGPNDPHQDADGER